MPVRPATLTDIRVDAAMLPDVRIVATPPKGKGIEAALGVSPLVVGSGAESDLVVPDPLMSRRHCEISLSDRGIRLRDLGSKNGTSIGGVQVIEALLEPDAKVTLGGSQLVARVGRGTKAVALSRAPRFGQALGASVAMRALFATLERASPTDETILLLGESGTGKEVLARAIHEGSQRRAGPYVVFDGSAVAPTLAEAELFGYVKGAFTGAVGTRPGLLEQAHGGTLFLDEIGELPLDLQPKLLRAIESRQVRKVGSAEWVQVDVRFVAATHRDLRAQVASGQFRQDLYYRLAVVEVPVPPLRERRDDIPLLVERFLAAQTPPRSFQDLPPNALELLSAHSWPGNVRELRNTVARLLLFPASAEQAFAPLVPAAPPSARGGAPSRPGLGAAEMAGLLRMQLREAREIVVEQFERSYVTAKLSEHAGNVSRAAESIGVSRQFLHRLIDRYGLKGDGGG
jgi:two-component system, NtrC family, response regulator GlrR